MRLGGLLIAVGARQDETVSHQFEEFVVVADEQEGERDDVTPLGRLDE